MPKKKVATEKQDTSRVKSQSSQTSSAVGDAMMELQQSIGNQATTQMIQTSSKSSNPSGFFQLSSEGYDYQVPQMEFIQEFNRDLQSSYDSAPSAKDATQFPHLNRQSDKGRRTAEIGQPSDRAALVKEAKDQGRAHSFINLETPSLFNPNETDKLGRIQNPRAKQLKNEQHFYDSDNKFTPYPREAQHLQDMATNGLSSQDVWKGLDAVNRGQKPPSAFEEHEQSLKSVPTIFNISEVQRSPLMGASSNLEIANQAQTLDTPKSFEQAFGKPKKRKSTETGFNMPGTISATGSGAVHQFKAVEESIMSGDMSDDAVKKKVIRAPKGSNVQEARELAVGKKESLLSTFEQRLQMTDVSAAQQEPDASDREAMTLTRLRSGIHRNTKPQMGLMPYNLRPLAKQNPDAMNLEEKLGQDVTGKKRNDRVPDDYFYVDDGPDNEYDHHMDDSIDENRSD